MEDGMSQKPMVGPSREDYLADIYRIQSDGRAANNGEVARRRGVTPASTSAMFRRLAQEGLIEHHSYGAVSLTPEGQRVASRVIRRHRVIERFLTDILGFGWEQVDEFADQMEHGMPDEVLGALERFLGWPETCSHGHPIPQEDGPMLPDVHGVPLEAIGQDHRVRICRLDESDPLLLKYLRDHGLTLGEELTVLEVNAIDGTRTLLAHGRKLVIGARIAQAVMVEQVGDDE